jgi:MoaA/NifB/PqqE/SkfB family radical SAM enzyme
MPGSGIDLTNQVTVFLPTVGASSFHKCRMALEEQDCQFTLDVIWNVAPMSAAFQQMLERCRTPYYIQCDEDMILKPHAVRTLYEAIKRRAGTQIGMVCFPLYDVHLQRTLLGVKAYRHDVFSQFPYRDVQSCEMDQIARLRKAGYGFDVEWGNWADHRGILERSSRFVLGDHGTIYGMREAFERYRDLTEKARFVGGSDWAFPWVATFLSRFSGGKPLDDPDLWAAIGCIVGHLTEREKAPGEKDYREYANMKDYGEIAAHVVDPPKRVDVYVTTKCNAKCTFCSRQHGNGPAVAKDFDVSMAERVLAEWPTITGACLAGFGDPLLSPGIGQLVDYFVSRGVYTSLITNGIALVDRRGDVDWKKLGYVNVSVNAATPEEHANRAGVQDGFRRAVLGLDMLLAEGANAGVSFVVGASNIDRIPDYLSFAKRRKAKFVSLVNVLPHHKAGNRSGERGFRDEVLSVRTTGAAAKILEFKRMAAQMGVEVWAWPEIINPNHNPRKCRSPFEALGVDGAGSISGCCRIVGPKPEHGNIGRGGDVWGELPYLRELRRELSGAADLRYPCTLCFGNWKGGA